MFEVLTLAISPIPTGGVVIWLLCGPHVERVYPGLGDGGEASARHHKGARWEGLWCRGRFLFFTVKKGRLVRWGSHGRVRLLSCFCPSRRAHGLVPRSSPSLTLYVDGEEQVLE